MGTPKLPILIQKFGDNVSEGFFSHGHNILRPHAF